MNLAWFTDDAKKVVAAIEAGRRIQWESLFANIAATFTDPTSPTDGTVQKALYGVADVLKVAGIVMPPAAAVGEAVDLAAGLEPIAAQGFEMLLRASHGQIPATTLHTEDEIAERFQEVFKVGKGS